MSTVGLTSQIRKLAKEELQINLALSLHAPNDELRRELIPWGIRVSRVHPSGVTGTEFNKKAKQNGGIRYRSVPIGRVSREQVARAVVGLVLKPRRAIFLMRLIIAAAQEIKNTTW